MSKNDHVKPKSSMKDFFTREAANNGRKMPLKTIDDNPTDDWLMVLGSESDVFRNMKAQYARDVMTADEGEEIPFPLFKLVTGWSFDEEFTEKHVVELFINAPYIELAVDYFSSNGANLLKKD